MARAVHSAGHHRVAEAQERDAEARAIFEPEPEGTT